VNYFHNTAQHIKIVILEKQLVCVLIDLFMAGPETLSNAMSFMVQFLVQYPQTQAKLQEEIDRVIGRVGVPHFSDLDR